MLDNETDAPGWGYGFGRHQFPDRFKHNAKLLVVFLLQFVQPTSKVCVGGAHFP